MTGDEVNLEAITQALGAQVLVVLRNAHEARMRLGAGYTYEYAHFTLSGTVVPAEKANQADVVTVTIEGRLTGMYGVYGLTMRFEKANTPINLFTLWPRLVALLDDFLRVGDEYCKWRPGITATNNHENIPVVLAA